MLAADRSDVALASSEGVRRILPVTGTGALLVLITGLLITAGEYRHGTAADTFLTTPRRHRVVGAKLVIGVGVGAATGMLMSLACVAVAAGIYQLKGEALPVDDAELWWTLVGVVVYSTLFAAIGVALGALVRNQVLAVAGALAWIAIGGSRRKSHRPSLARIPALSGVRLISLSSSPSPSQASAATAVGPRPSPAPTGANASACSNTVTSQPSRLSARAVASPPIPPPTMSAVRGRWVGSGRAYPRVPLPKPLAAAVVDRPWRALVPRHRSTTAEVQALRPRRHALGLMACD